MVNFRFHLISLVGVFLALGIGLLMGSTVIDQGVVRGLEQNVSTFKEQRDEARSAASERGDELDRWRRFEEEARDQLLMDRLEGVPVVLVAVEGTARQLVEDVHDWLRVAGAADQGTVWLDEKLAVADGDDVAELARIVGTPATRPEVVRREALAALAGALAPVPPVEPPPDHAAAGDPEQGPATTAAAPPPDGAEEPRPSLLVALREAGFLDYDAVGNPPTELGAIPVPATRLVLLSGAGVQALDPGVGVPLAGLLARRPGALVVAAEARPGGADDLPAAEATPVVAALRDDEAARGRISTVDDAGSFHGQLALLLAVEDLAGAVTGHYGVGEGADRLLPAGRP